MKLAKITAVLLFTMLSLGALSAPARAELGYATANNRLYITTSGILGFLPASGEFRSSPGGANVPVCGGSLGMLFFHQSASGVAHSDVMRERLLSILNAAILSGKNFNINFTRTANNQCFIDNIFFNTPSW